MISVFMSINNNEEVIELPIVPEGLPFDSPFNNEAFDTMSQELNLFGVRGLGTMELTSFFPIRDYPFLRTREMWGMEYVHVIERWRDRRLPIRLVVANTDPNGFALNKPFSIENFRYSVKRNGDIEYSLSLREFVLIRQVD